MEGPENSVTPVATGTPGDTAQPAPVQGDKVQPAPGQGDSAQPATVSPAPDKGPVPYDRFEQVNRKANDFEARNADLANQVAQYQTLVAQIAAANRGPQQALQPAAPPDPLAGFTDEELLDPSKIRQGFSQALNRVREEVVAEARNLVGQVQFQVQYADFDSLVGANNPITGQFAPSELMAEAIKEDPQLPAKIQQSGNPRVFAYEIAKRHKQLRELRKAAQQPTPAPAPQPTLAHQVLAAQQASQSISAASGAGALDKISHIRNMSNAEFAEYWAGVKAGRGAVT